MAGDTSLQAPAGILIGARVVLVTVFLGISQVIGSELGTRPWMLTAWIVALYGVTVLYALLYPRFGGSKMFAAVQLLSDVVAVTLLVGITGGIASWFSFAYLLIVIAAVILLGRAAGFLIAFLGIISYGFVLNLQHQGLRGLTLPRDLEGPDVLYNLFTHAVLFLLVAALTGYLSDKLRRATETLEEKEVSLSDLQVFSKDVLENSPVGMVTAGSEGTVIICNPAAASACSCLPEDMLGRRLTDMFPFLDHWHDWNPRAEGELEIDGECRTLGYSLTPLKNRKGEVTGSILIFRDLTDLRAMEEEMRRKQELAAIGELSASIAHELRNPLASLKNSIEIIREEGAEGKHNERLMDIAVHEMDRLNVIISDFLDYARPQTPDMARFDLSEAIRETLVFVEHPEQVVVEQDITAPLLVTGDPSQLRQVIWNVVLNAIEAMEGHGTLSVSARDVGNAVEMIFRDTGPGIPEEEQERIFFPFYSTKQKGTGLGLAITYRIIEAHGGAVQVRSAPGQGAEFIIRLPHHGAENSRR